MEDDFLDISDKDFYQQINKQFSTDITKFQPNEKNIIIFGWNSDEGTLINGGRVGGEKGPYYFRESLKSSSLIPLKNQEKLNIYDFGNTKEDETEDITLEEAHIVLGKRVSEFLKIKNCMPFIIGGSNDQSFPNGNALINQYPNEKVAVINIDAHFDVRGQKDGKEHSGSPFRMICENKTFIQNKSILVEFANQGAQCSLNHYNFIKENGGKVYWLEKDIRRFQIDKSNKLIKTQAGQLMQKILNSLVEEDKCSKIFFSFDVDSIHSQYCPGVSAPSVIGGLTDEESAELSFLAGLNKNVYLMDMSEFNPAVESGRTGMLLAGLFYQFCKGYLQRQ